MNFSEDNIDKIYLCVAGSHAYGTSTPASDLDKRGIFIAPKEHVWGIEHVVEQVEDKGNGNDIEFLELKHYMKLCIDQNPNIIEYIWTDQSDVLFKHPVMDKLINAKHELLSSKAKFTFSGYAHSQLNRIRGHNKWLSKEDRAVNRLNSSLAKKDITWNWIEKNFGDKIKVKVTSPKHEGDLTPEMDFLLRDPDINLVSTHGPQIGYYCNLITTKGHVIKLTESHIDTISKISYAVKVNDSIYRLYTKCENESVKPGLFNDKNKAELFCHDSALFKEECFSGVLMANREDFKADLVNWKDYHTWVRERNPARAAMEAKHGIDTKHLAHLVRLLRMGKEILTEHVVRVKRPDAEELLAIRNGAWAYDDAIKYAESMDKELDELYKTTTLRKVVDIKFANQLYLKMAEEWYATRI